MPDKEYYYIKLLRAYLGLELAANGIRKNTETLLLEDLLELCRVHRVDVHFLKRFDNPRISRDILEELFRQKGLRTVKIEQDLHHYYILGGI